MGWMESGGIRKYDISTENISNFGWHLFYAGNNALKLIEIPPDMIPRNVTVKISQSGSSYELHVISYSDEAINEIDIPEILLSNGFIE
jgi:hypothetical protein